MTEMQRDIDIQSRLLKLEIIVPDKNYLSFNSLDYQD